MLGCRPRILAVSMAAAMGPLVLLLGIQPDPAVGISGAEGAAQARQTQASKPDGIYTPVTDREIYQLIASDYQEIVALADQVDEGRPLPAGDVLKIYEEAKLARIGPQARPLRGFARDAARATEFPRAAAFFGSPTFLDDPVIDAIAGIRSAQDYSPAERRQAIQKGILRIIYHWSARYVALGAVNLNPGLVDEAWAIYMGTEVDGRYPNSLSATAVAREADFDRPGAIDAPLREALSRAQKAAGDRDAAAYAEAERDVYSRFNAIFYLSTALHLSEALRSAQAEDHNQAAVHQIEGLAYYQSIQPTVANADPRAGESIVAYFQAAPVVLSVELRDGALGALNRAADALLLRPPDLVTPELLH